MLHQEATLGEALAQPVPARGKCEVCSAQRRRRCLVWGPGSTGGGGCDSEYWGSLSQRAGHLWIRTNETRRCLINPSKYFCLRRGVSSSPFHSCVSQVPRDRAGDMSLLLIKGETIRFFRLFLGQVPETSLPVWPHCSLLAWSMGKVGLGDQGRMTGKQRSPGLCT